jgi:hypothetical protein
VDADSFLAIFIVKMLQQSSTLCIIELVLSSVAFHETQEMLDARELPQFGNIEQTDLSSPAEYIAQALSYQL